MRDDNLTNDIDDYADQTLQLLKLAKGHGISAYCILHTIDPIAGTCTIRYVSTADQILCLGMLQAGMMSVQDAFGDNEWEETD